ncbi:MAG: hypothetical protein EP298_01710 [Gammaproteobacteria bacterium]|nr:MAG: hypothetical protein EP298_01710 [Gammaproteobacteria bacterium]UTW43921.1 hypothetical protein KFE69_07480 [bacterium SCSIO 12844]
MNLCIDSNIPSPLFDTKEYLFEKNSMAYDNLIKIKNHDDYYYSKLFLKQHSDKVGTFNSYRREVERLLHWSWLIANKSLSMLNINDLREYLKFCESPSKLWIGSHKVRRFIVKEDYRIPNPQWRPYINSDKEIKSSNHKYAGNSHLENSSINEILMILSSFFNYLLNNKFIDNNPMQALRQVIKPYKKMNINSKVNKFNKSQINLLLKNAEEMAEDKPDIYERTFFVVSLLCYTQLLPSELITKNSFMPQIKHIYQDNLNRWQIKTNKDRNISLNDKAMNALIRWSMFLGFKKLSDMPGDFPLIPKYKGYGNITTTTHLRRIIDDLFNYIIDKLNSNERYDEANILKNKVNLSWFNF